jgi:lysophospholipase L1-like esterase
MASAGESADVGVTITQPVPFAEGPFEGVLPLGAELPDAAPFLYVVPFPEAPPPVEVAGSNGFALPAPPAPPESVSPPEPTTPSLFRNFSGPTDPGTVIPPDTMGAVGPSHALNTLNSGVAAFDKATGVKISETTLPGFWAPLGTGAGQPAGSTVFDTKVLYDQGSGRFLFVTLGGSSSPNSWLLLAVSATSDPAGAWSRWAIDADLDGGFQLFGNWADFPGLGVDDNNVYVTANMFNASNVFQYPKVWVIPKAQLLSGSGTLTWTEFRAPFAGTSNGFTMQPAHTFGPAPAQFFVHEGYFIPGTPPRRFLRLSAVTFPAGAPTWNDLGFIEVNSYPIAALPLAPQQNDNHPIATNDTRMLNAVYRNGSLWATHTVGNSASTRTEAAWYELDPSVAGPVSLPGTPVQQGRVSDPNRFYFFPSIAVNGSGDAGLGFSGSSPSEFAGAFYTVRGSGDPPGTTQPVATLQAGLSTYFKDFGSGRNRWGDYSGTSVDPSDDATFWTTQEYAASPANTWGIWWGAFRVGAPSVVLTADPPDTATPGTFVTFTGSAVGGAGPFEYEFQARFTNGTYGVVRNYTTDNTWTWDTTGAPATGYEVLVNVRRAGTTGPDATASIPYTLHNPPPVEAPATTTTAATSITTDGAVLHGDVNPNGLTTNAWFEYGTDPGLSSPASTAPQSVGSGTGTVSFSASISGLVPWTTQFYRAVASNGGGTQRGAINSFPTGEYYVAVGDSITAGSHDDILPDGTGFEPILRDRLSVSKGYPHTVANEGVSGATSADGAASISATLAAHPSAKYYLVLYGTNDADPASGPVSKASYVANMQAIITAIQSAGKIPYLAKVPYVDPTNPSFPAGVTFIDAAIQQYNQAIDELRVSNNISVVAPDFYAWFQAHPEELADGIHPNGFGYDSMVTSPNMWFEVLP